MTLGFLCGTFAPLAQGCASQSAAAASTQPVAKQGADSASIEIPMSPATAPAARVRVAIGLDTPRGMHVAEDGSLLVSIAGTGDPASPMTGGLVRLRDANADGDFDDAGERSALLEGKPSKNILEIVRRDEVFGMAGMAAGENTVLVALAFFGGPSTIFRIDGDRVSEWGSTQGNVNDVAFDPKRKQWMAVASTTDEVIRLIPGGRAERVVKFATLASGQDAVPGYLRHDPRTGDLLVSLFSGSPEGEEGGEGVEIVPRAASIVRVTPETRQVTPVVTALTVPTDLEIGPDGSIYVLEFCDAFLDPVETRADMQRGPSHGGFRRFSGRLLRIDREHGQVSVLATGLDAPTNLELAGDSLYIAQGMGTPGRLIPGPNGQGVPLTGFIERLALPAH
jgi:hypothetical protein